MIRFNMDTKIGYPSCLIFKIRIYEDFFKAVNKRNMKKKIDSFFSLRI